MEATLLKGALFFINLLLAGVLWFMKQEYQDLKLQLREHSDDLKKVKEDYFKKTDFLEFKSDLWSRLDRLESSWNEKINGIRKL
jgi:hypothetical protein